MNKYRTLVYFLIFCSALVTGGCSAQSPQPDVQAQAIDPDPANWVEYTLTTGMDSGRMVFIGVGGEIDARINPELTARRGDTVRVVLINGDGMPHDLVVLDFDVQTALVSSRGQDTDAIFTADESGTFAYYCSVAGHRQAGMEGKLIVEEP